LTEKLIDFPASSCVFITSISERAPEQSVILLVDDREDDILLARQALEVTGILNPLYALSDGEEAVLYLEGFGPFANRNEFPLPDLVLLDIKMPKIDGFKVLKWIRAHSHLKSLPIVMLTSSDDADDISKAYHLGANAFLIKPSDFTCFCEMMRSLVSFWLHHTSRPELKRRPRWGRPTKE
jgi:CheY-like chemotaxis protein